MLWEKSKYLAGVSFPSYSEPSELHYWKAEFRGWTQLFIGAEETRELTYGSSRSQIKVFTMLLRKENGKAKKKMAGGVSKKNNSLPKEVEKRKTEQKNPYRKHHLVYHAQQWLGHV